LTWVARTCLTGRVVLRAARGSRPRLVLADLSVVEQRYRAVLAVQCAVVW
jgi:hypothetical protein